MGAGILPNLIHLHRAQQWGRSRALQSQLALLRSLVSAARRNVPLYRERFAGIPRDRAAIRDFADFHRLPLLTKADIKANFPDRILSRRAHRQQLYPIATSGTTDRVMTFHDEQKRDWDRAADLLMGIQGEGFRPFGRRVVIPPDACYERCGADEHGRVESVMSKMGDFLRAGRGRRFAAARQVVSQFLRDYVWRLQLLKALGVDGTATSAEKLGGYVADLARIRPHVLRSLPIYLFILAKHRQHSPGDALAAVIRPAGGKFTPYMIETVERGLGGVVREEFGTAELGTVACDCGNSRRQHLFSELFYMEFMRGGRHVAPGELGEIVITDLRNFAAPLIRYALGDVGRFGEEVCGCGRQGLLFTVHSRLDETIVTPHGRAFAGDEVIDFFLRFPGVDYARLVQQGASNFLLEIVPAAGCEVPAAAAVSQRFSQFLDCAVTVQLRIVRRISPERSGKYRLVVSSSSQDFHRTSEPREVERNSPAGADRTDDEIITTAHARDMDVPVLQAKTSLARMGGGV